MKIPALFGLIAALAALPAAAQTPPPAGPVHFPTVTNSATFTPVPLSTPKPQVTLPPAASTPSSADTAGDIRDIHGPISIPYQWLWALYLVGALAMAAALYAGWRAYRRHAVAKARLPHEIALERLEAARALMTDNQVREYAFEVSEIVRSYIEKRFGEKAARRTTEEFLSDLLKQTGTPLAEHRGLLEDFLHHCDLPKFARWQLSVREMEAMQESARSFIVNTQPQPKPVPPVKAGAPVQPELAQAK